MSESPPSPKKIRVDSVDLSELSKEDLINKLKDQDKYIRHLEDKQKLKKGEEDKDYKELEAKLKQQQKDAVRRENTLVHRLTSKEQELQDYINQIQEFKQQQTQNTAQLKSMLLDPAVNLVFQRMTKEMEDSQEKLKQTQNELSAWKFTPDSQTGKRLMAKCRMLFQENEELGKVQVSGRTAKLEAEIVTQKELVQDMKNNQAELDEFLGDLEEDVEGMQSMIYVLQQQLKESKEQVTHLQEENTRLQSQTQTNVYTSPHHTDNHSPIKQECQNDTIVSKHSNLSDSLVGQQTETSSDTEMETDAEPTSKNYLSGSEPNHVLQFHSSISQNYESTDDFSNDGWTSPPHERDSLNGKKLANTTDSTPELDRLSEKDFPTGGEVLQNGVNRTPIKMEEVGEA